MFIQAAKDNSKLAIGVDSNQNYLHPGTMLTSMVKRVDVAVYDAMKSAKEGTWQSGVRVLILRSFWSCGRWSRLGFRRAQRSFS